MFNKQDQNRNAFMLDGAFYKNGYDWWWHSFTAVNEATGEEVPFFIEFFAVNPGLNKGKTVFGQMNKAGKDKPCYMMVKAGCWGRNKMQLHRFFSWDEVRLQARVPYSVSAADCYADETKLKGSISISKDEAKMHPEWMCDAGEMSWELTVDKQIAYNVGYGASSIFRAMKAFEMYWHVEGMKSAYSGVITANGQRYIIKPESSYGYADKNWGSDFTSPWVWLSSNCLYSKARKEYLKNSVFDIGGGKPRVFGVALDRKLLGGFYYEGEEYEFNFSKFWTGSRTQFSYEETEDKILWHVRQENNKAVMVTEIACNKEDMLLVNYEAPNGKKLHNRLWNGGNGYGTVYLYRKEKGDEILIDEIEVSHVGCEYGEYCEG